MPDLVQSPATVARAEIVPVNVADLEGYETSDYTGYTGYVYGIKGLTENGWKLKNISWVELQTQTLVSTGEVIRVDRTERSRYVGQARAFREIPTTISELSGNWPLNMSWSVGSYLRIAWTVEGDITLNFERYGTNLILRSYDGTALIRSADNGLIMYDN